MKKAKNILIFILILIIIGLVCYIVFGDNETPNNIIKNKTTKTTAKQEKEEEKNFVSKIDNSKGYIFDGDYKGDFSKDSYTTESGKTYRSKDLKAPYFNIDSSDANNANKEVNETYLNAVRLFNQGVNDKSTYIKLSYKKYESDNVISALFKYEVGDVGTTNPIYYTYNFDNKTGQLITFKKAMEIAGIKEDEIDKKVKDAITKEIKKQMGDSKDVYPEGETINTYINRTYSGYEVNKQYDLMKYILDSNNKLSVVVDFRLPVELEHINGVLEIN